MLFSKSCLLAIAAAVGLVSAQTTSPDTPAGSVKTHVVMVSDKTGTLSFMPEEIVAAAGELVQFHFYPKNHSLAQSSFAAPCSPLPATNGTMGFWSGFMPVTSMDTTMPVFTVLVKDTSPIWFYCATAKHCQSGMTGVINSPNSTAKTLALYKEAAQAVVMTGVPASAAGTGGDDDTSSGTPSSGNSSDPTTSGQPEITVANPNAGSAMVASSAFALVAAAVVAAFAL